MDFFNTNRFRVDVAFEERFDELLGRLSTSDGTPVDIQKIRTAADEELGIAEDELAFHLSGCAKLQFDEQNVSAGLLKLTGNLPAFYKEAAPMIDSEDAMIVSSVSVSDDGWLAAKSAVVTQTGIEENDLVGGAISAAARLTGNDMYTTDMHRFQ